MRTFDNRFWLRLSSLVLVSLTVVYAVSTPAGAAGQPKAGSKTIVKALPDSVPGAVREMIEMIQAAAQSGQIEELRDAIDWNEMKPDFGVTGVTDPVSHWRGQSKDGTGKEVLVILAALLAGKPAIVPYGRDLENNRLFVWPSFAEKPLKALTVAEVEQFNALVAEPDRAAMVASDVYLGWRLVLGADGTWHTFRSGP